MRFHISKALALLGGVATLGLCSTFVMRLPAVAAKQKAQQDRCSPRLLELEQAVCEPAARPLRLAEPAVELALGAAR